MMTRREILTQDYAVSADRLWNVLKLALVTVDGVTLQTTAQSRHTATFQTGMTWTSWGQNMSATVEALDSGHARLNITGQLRSAFLSSGWGESLHRQAVVQRLKPAIDRALASSG